MNARTTAVRGSAQTDVAGCDDEPSPHSAIGQSRAPLGEKEAWAFRVGMVPVSHTLIFPKLFLSVSGRSKPATSGRIKPSHFEVR